MTLRRYKAGARHSPGEIRGPRRRGGFVLLAFAAASLAFAHCAYFNVLYNARLKYDEAQDMKKRADPEREKISPQEEKLYQEAFEKAAKVVRFYPDSKWVDDALLLMGKSSFEKGDYSTAIRKFDEILTFFPDSKLTTEALLMKGRTHVATKEYGEARAALMRASGVAEKKWHGDIAYFLGVVYQEEGDTTAAKSEFATVLDEHEKSEWYGEAGMRLGNLAEEEGDLGGAVADYQAAHENAKTAEERFRAGMRMGETLLEMGAWDAADKAFRDIANKAFEDEKRGEALIMTGRVALAKGDTERAISIFQDILARMERTPAAAEAQYQIGKIYDDAGDYERAMTEYELVREQGTGNPAYGKALARQALLEKVLDLRAEIAGVVRKKDERETSQPSEREGERPGGREEAPGEGGETREEEGAAEPEETIVELSEEEKEKRRFLLAEHLLEKIGDVNAALAEYSTLAKDARGSEWGARSLFAEAWIYENRLARPDTAESLLFQLANFYSGTEVASAARRCFGFPVWQVEVVDAPPVFFIRPEGDDASSEDIFLTRAQPREAKLPEGVAQSEVWVRAYIGADGTCERTKVVKSGCPDCDASALEAARASVFLPPEEGGAPITVLRYEFPPPPPPPPAASPRGEPEPPAPETSTATAPAIPDTLESAAPAAADSAGVVMSADSLSASAAVVDSLSSAGAVVADSLWPAASDSAGAVLADSSRVRPPSLPAAVRDRRFEPKRDN
jgi:TolA-binding protein